MGVIVVGGVPNPPPAAPVLLTPPNGTYADLSGTPTFSWQYVPGKPGNTQSQFYFLRLVSGGSQAYYWNGGNSTWQTTSYPNPGITTTSNPVFSYTFPSGAWSDGTSYQWAVVSIDINGTGAQSGYFTVNAQAAPVVRVTAPSGIITTATPVVTWSVSTPSGAQQTSYRVIIYNQSQYSASGFTPGTSTGVYDSGQQGSTFVNSLALESVGVYLDDGTQYRAYVQVTEIGGEYSTWAYAAFTTYYAQPKPPTITVGTGNEPTTGYPWIETNTVCHDNLLSTADAIDPARGTSVGSWVAGSNTTLGSGNAPLVNTFGLSMTASAAGNISANTATGTAGYAITAGTQYTGIASLIAATTGRSCTVGLAWYNSSGTLLSTSTGSVISDTTTGLTQASVTATAPTGATYATVVVTVESAAASEVHWFQSAGIFPGTDTTWGPGGFVGLQEVVLLRSDGLYVRGASTANPAAVPASTQQVTVPDPEPFPFVTFTYTAQVLVVLGPNQTALSPAVVSGAVTLSTTEWWQCIPSNVAGTAVNAQFVHWQPVQTEQSTAQPATGSQVLIMVANTMLHQDFTATAETFTDAVYLAFNALLRSQQTIFIQSPFGENDSGWFRVGPQTGGLSTGVGNQAKQTTLKQGSVAGTSYRSVAVTAIAQNRPAV